MAELDEGRGQSVLDLLGPLMSTYVRRASGRPSTAAPRHAASVRIVEGPYVPCFVEAVVTVDSKGRVSWPRGVRSSAGATVELGDGPAIEVTFGEATSSITQPIDGRGRLQLPQGLMQAVGIRPGDRVAVIRRVDRDGFGLAPAGSLGVRQGAA